MRFYQQVIGALVGGCLTLLVFYAVYVGWCLDDPRASQVFGRDELPIPENYTLPRKEYNVWVIFVKVKDGFSPIRFKLQRMLASLLKHSTVPLTLNLLIDPGSKDIAREAVLHAVNKTGKDIKVRYEDMAAGMRRVGGLVSSARAHFAGSHASYYSDALFFASLGLHLIAPPDQQDVVMLDADLVLKEDIARLFDEFDKFSSEELVGLSYELSPVYEHVLYWWRGKHPGARLGRPAAQGGYPGLNSGVLLLRLDSIRLSTLYHSLLSSEHLDALTTQYSFKGHLGDQDFYTLIGWTQPELIHRLDCGWNRQLCTWWRDHGYRATFAKFAVCDSPTRILHGNCNTPVPED